MMTNEVVMKLGAWADNMMDVIIYHYTMIVLNQLPPILLPK